MVDQWVTHREAALLLGVHVSLIPKMLRRGDLTSRRGRPSLSREEVVELAAARRTAATGRERRHLSVQATGPPPPDEEHEWLLIPTAAVVLGCTEGALKMRVNRGRVSYTVHGGAPVVPAGPARVARACAGRQEQAEGVSQPQPERQG